MKQRVLLIASLLTLSAAASAGVPTCDCRVAGTLNFHGAWVPGGTVSVDDVTVNNHFVQNLTFSAECTYPIATTPVYPDPDILKCTVTKDGQPYTASKSGVRFGAMVNRYLCEIVLEDALKKAGIPERRCSEK